MSSRMLITLAAVALLAGLAFGRPARAQGRWLQTVQVIAPVEQDSATGALLDTLVSIIERGEDLPLRRAPDRAANQSLSALENTLLNEGLDFTSANRVFITYRLEADQRGFTEKITGLFFIYRPSTGVGDTDIPIFYLDASNPAVREALVQSGMQLHANEAAMRPFRKQLSFTRLRNEGTIVTVGDRVIRDSTEAKAESHRLFRTIRRLAY